MLFRLNPFAMAESLKTSYSKHFLQYHGLFGAAESVAVTTYK